jgi:hypothetical protein
VDLGISIGALSSKTITLKTRKFIYHVIAAYQDEPACNPVQMILNVEEPSFRGVGTVTYNFGFQVSGIQSAKISNGDLVLLVRRNSIENCAKHFLKTLRVTYKGNGSDLVVNQL